MWKEEYAMKKGLAASICLLLASGWGNAYASSSQVYELNPVVVTVDKYESQELKAPATVNVITNKQIKQMGVESAFEALRRVPGVTSVAYNEDGGDYGGMFSRINVRGFDMGTQVLLNGMPLNLNNYNSSVSMVPIDAIDRIEVVKGSNSVLYGAQAMGGVVNIITKKGGVPESKVGVKYGNYRKGYDVSTQGEKYLFSVKRSYTDRFNDARYVGTGHYPRMDRGKQYFTNVFASYSPNDNWDLSYAYKHSDNSWINTNWKKDSKTKKYKYITETSYGEHTREDVMANYHDNNGFRSSFGINSMWFHSWKSLDHNYKSASKSQDWNWDSTKKWNLRDGKDSLIVGFDLDLEKYNKPLSPMKKNGHSYNDLNRRQYALYTSYTYNPNDRLSITAGMREHWVKKNVYDDSQNIFLPQVQFSYKLMDHFYWYGNAGKSFQMPEISGPFGKSVAISKYTIDLKPEEAKTYETGFKFNDGKRSAQLAFFKMDVKNKFKWVTQKTVFPNDPDGADSPIQINLGKYKNSGVELSYSQTINNNWDWNAGVYLANPKGLQDGGTWQQEDARQQYTAGINYHNQRWDSSLNLLLVREREWAAYNRNYTKPKKGHTDHRVEDTLDLTWTLAYRPTDNDSIELVMNNILDRHNPVMYTEYYALPFNYTISYSHKF